MNATLRLLRPTAILRRLAAQLAFVAVLAAALMPTLTRIALPEGLADGAAICQSAPTGASQGIANAHDDACLYCALAHATPALSVAASAAPGIVAFAPPAPLAPAPVRASVAQARPPAARGPPPVA